MDGETSLRNSSRSLNTVEEISNEVEQQSKQASLNVANAHYDACRIQKRTHIHFPADYYCLCLRLPLFSGPPGSFTWKSDVRELVELGKAYPLLFYTIWYLALMLAFGLIAALPNLVCNIVSDNHDNESIYVQMSIHGSGEDLEWWYVVLHLIYMVGLSSLYLTVKNRLMWRAHMLSEEQRSIADFSVFLKNLGRSWQKEDLVTHIKDKMRYHDDKELLLDRISISYDIQKVSVAKSKYRECFGDQHDNRGLCPSICRVFKWKKNEPLSGDIYERQKTERKEAIRKALAEMDETGVAIATFKSTVQVRKLLRRWGNTFQRRALSLLCGSRYSDPQLLFRTNTIRVSKAPDPSDIIWSNLKYSRKSRNWRQICSQLVMLGLLALTISLVAFVILGDNYFENHEEAIIFQTPFAFLILIANQILAKIANLMATFECHHTHSGLALSIAKKVTLLQLANTLLSPLVILALIYIEQLAEKPMLATEITNTAIGAAFLSPLLDIVLSMINWKVNNMWTKRRMQTPDVYISQRQANKSFELPRPNTAIWYGQLLVKFLYAWIFCPIAPVIVPISLLGLVFEYSVKKVYIIYWCRQPVELNERLALSIINFLLLGFPLNGTCLFVAVYIIGAGEWTLRVAFCCLLLGGAFFVVPVIGCTLCLTWPVPMDSDEGGFDEMNGYDYKNPATKLHKRNKELRKMSQATITLDINDSSRPLLPPE